MALLARVSAAHAIPLESHITSPTDPTYLFDETAHSPTFTVAGTANVAEVEIRCYFGSGTTIGSYSEIDNGTKEEKVKVIGGAFSVSEPEASLPIQPAKPCVLRAVPAGNKEAHPPGTTDPFSGPRVLKSVFGPFEEAGVVNDYDFEADTFSAYLGIGSVGDEGLYFSFLFAPGTLEESVNGFWDDASLSGENRSASGSATRSELQIDSLNAYSPFGARKLGEELTEEPVKKIPGHMLPGTPSVSVEKSYEPLTGEGVLHESDPIVRCAPEPNVYPPTITSCTSFVSTGVQLHRTWQATHGDHVALMNDAWTSTDGRSHTLDGLYDQEIGSEEIAGAFLFPGAPAFASVVKGQSVPLPSGSGAIYFKVNGATPAAGDLHDPQLAIVYDSATDGPLTFYAGDGGKKERAGFEMHYARTIPAGGSYDLRMGYVTEYALGAVEGLAKEILAGYPPSVSISSPANGATVSTPTVTVTGSASDTGAVSSVAVNGHAATVAANGTWSVSVPLSAGANTLTAVATDQAGLTSNASVTVTYKPPPALPSARQVGVVVAKNGQVGFRVACTGTAGQKCKVLATLTTVEKLHGAKLIAVSAKHGHGPKVRFKTITVGSAVVTIPAGETVGVTIGLNGTGKRLLAKYHRLPVHLSVVLVSGTTRSTVISQNLVVQPKSKHRPKRHRR